MGLETNDLTMGTDDSGVERMTPEEKVLFFKQELSSDEHLRHEKEGNHFDPALLTDVDIATWKAYKLVTPGEDDGVAFMHNGLANYADELNAESERLRGNGESAVVNENSQRFRHFLAQTYIIDSMSVVERKIKEKKVA